MITEIGELEASSQVYNVITNYSGSTSDGETRYNSNTGAIDVMVSQNYGMSGLGHELKHAYQFEKGELDFNSNSGGPGALYDITDEIQAYRRQAAISGRNMNSITTNYVRALTNSTGQKIYDLLPRGALNSNMFLGTINLVHTSSGVPLFRSTLHPNQAATPYRNFASKVGYIIK